MSYRPLLPPRPAELGVESRPVFPLWVNVEFLVLFYVLGVPNAVLGGDLEASHTLIIQAR